MASTSGTAAPEVSPSSDELILAARGGDSNAFGVLAERYGRRLYSFALRFTGDTHAAEDVAQETLLRAFRAAGRFQPRASFSSWLFTIARNLLMDRARRGGGRKVVSLPDEDSSVSESINPDGKLRLLEMDPADRVLQRELSEAVKEAVLELPDSQREVIVLAKYHGLAYGEIAEIVGGTQEAVKQKAYRALLSLRKSLAPYMSPESEPSSRPAQSSSPAGGPPPVFRRG